MLLTGTVAMETALTTRGRRHKEAAEQKGQHSAGVRPAHPSVLPSAPSQVLLNAMKTLSIPPCPTLGESVSRALCTCPNLPPRFFSILCLVSVLMAGTPRPAKASLGGKGSAGPSADLSFPRTGPSRTLKRIWAAEFPEVLRSCNKLASLAKPGGGGGGFASAGNHVSARLQP